MKVFIYSIVCWTIISCYSSGDNHEKIKIINDIFSENNYKIHNKKISIVVYPIVACDACSEEVINLINKRCGSKDIFFIIPNSNKKSLSIKFGNKILNCNNVLIDKNRRIQNFEWVSENIILIHIDGKMITKQIILYPSIINKQLKFL